MRATETPVSLNDSGDRPIQIIVDSGSDITLISQKTLNEMVKPPKVRTGQRIKLVQVTGNAIITRYVALDVYFHTREGPVLVKVEAYVVKGMSALLILGNDFADQYSISLLREEGESTLLFGKSGQSTKVHNSITTSLLDEEGHTFKIFIQHDNTSKMLKGKLHQKSQKIKRRTNWRSKDDHVRAALSVQIAPESMRLVKVQANFGKGEGHLLMEKKLMTTGEPESVYGCANMLISKKSSYVYVSNFSEKPINISVGQSVSQGHDPLTWLDKEDQFTKKEVDVISTHTNLLQMIINSGRTSVNKNPFTKMTRSEVEALQDSLRQDYSSDDILAEPPVEGGPKTAEIPGEATSSVQLMKEVDISPNLTEVQVSQLQEILRRHERVFGLEGRLGHYETEVDIPLLPNTKLISIPPYQASPANREVIDKQMDTWIELGVTEPSKSPWGAPVFIVY